MVGVPLNMGKKEEPIDSPELCDVLDDLAASAGGDAKIIIYRQNDRAKLDYLETVQLAVMSAQGLGYIQRKWGGGDYRLQVHGKKEAGGRAAIQKTFDVCIGALPTVQPTPSPAQTAYAQQPQQSGWDSEKIIAVLTAAAPLVRAGAEWWSSRQPITMQPYNNPVQPTSGLAALSETLMSLQIMGQLKDTVGDVFGNVATDNSGDKRSTMLQALAPALGAMLGQQQPTPAAPVVVENVSRETIHEEGKDELNEPNEYETILALIAESIKAGNQDTVIALLTECTPAVGAAILGATGMQIAMFAAKFGVSVTAVKASLANAREVLNENPNA